MLRQALNGRVCLVGLVVVVFSPVVAIAGDTVELKLKFPPGRHQYVEMSADIQQSIKGAMAPGGQMNVKITHVTGVMEKVVSSSKDGAKIVFLYDRRGMTFDHPMFGDLRYDSDMPSEDEAPYIKQICAPYVGMSTTMELDGSDQVRSFSGMDAILKKISAEAAGNPFFSEMKSGITNDAAKLTWGDNRWIVLPDHPVKPGDTWKRQNENDVPQIGKLVSDFSCKLERITDSNGRKLAVIAYTGKTTQPQPDGEDGSASTQGGGLKLKEDATFKGTATVDVDAGQIINQTRDMQMTLEMPSPGGGESPAMLISIANKETTVVKSPAEREKEKRENLAKARAKKAEEEKAEPSKPKADSE